MFKVVLAIMLTLTTLAGLEPKTIELSNLDARTYGYLAMTGKESCKGLDSKAQVRADRICFSKGHLQAVKGGFVTVMTNNEDLVEIIRSYDERQVFSKDYRCKFERTHTKVLSMRKFKTINCLTE